MLAATPIDSQGLGLLRLILTVVSERSGSIPEPLQNHLLAVISQAKLLNVDPTAIKQAIMPESIELALEMKVEKGLANELESITTFDTIGAERADRILKEIGNCPVC